jgi:SAM-dependent methyltransferase
VTLQLRDDRPPVPPADLVLRVVPTFDADDIQASLTAFDLDALRHLHCFERALAITGRTLGDFRRLLDFGCGCGRFLRHLSPIADAVEIHGTDIDSEMIDWLKHNIPYGSYEVALHEPPLPYPDGHFDLILNHSVFTHLDEAFQDMWLGELQRISSPNALLLLTVEGTSSWNRLRDGARGDPNVVGWHEEFQSRGIVHVRDDTWVGSTHPDFYHSTFHAPWYIFEHWTRYFDIVAYLPDGSDRQDLIVLRRRPDGAAVQTPIMARVSPERVRLLAPGGAARTVIRRLRRVAGSWRRVGAPPLHHEVRMLRSGLYEQGKRISVVTAELRREIEAVKARMDASDGGPD